MRLAYWQRTDGRRYESLKQRLLLSEVYPCPMKLIKQRRNEIFRAVISGGLDPIECELTSMADGSWKISHIPSDSYMTLDYYRAFTATGKIPDGPPVGVSSPEWSSVVDSVQRWATMVVETRDDPDLWETLRRGKEVLRGAIGNGLKNTPFTLPEQAGITRQLGEIKDYIRQERLLSGEQLALVEARFDQAEEASRHLGRKDWVLLFSGAILSLVVADLLPPSVAEQILMTVLHGLEHLFGIHVVRSQLPPTNG